MSDGTVFDVVNRYVFGELERIDRLDATNDPELFAREIERAKAIGCMAKVAIDNASMAVNATRAAAEIGTTPSRMLGGAKGGRP